MVCASYNSIACAASLRAFDVGNHALDKTQGWYVFRMLKQISSAVHVWSEIHGAARDEPYLGTATSFR